MKSKNTDRDMRIIHEVRKEISNYIIGQKYMIDRILIGIFTGTNILLEGLPGLAKTSTVSTIAKLIGLNFRRIQFTPDLLPSDIIGNVVYYQKVGEFITKKGPIFSNIILADEINRAPAKVQSALLEAMQEKQVTIGGRTYKLDLPFIVLATQNPIEHDGTYPLPEAQQDRFLMKLKISYPSKEEERAILNKFADNNRFRYNFIKLVSKTDIFSIRESIKSVHLDDKLKDYIIDIILKSREHSKHVVCGASPRGTLALVLCSKAIAFFKERNYVTAEDIREIAPDVLRHRIIMNSQAKHEGIHSSQIIEEILKRVKVY